MEEDQGRVMRQRSPQAHARRKGNGSRPWRVITESGHSHLEQVRKHSLMRRTGLHTRDFRLLDPVLSYSSSILGRERAIVINLEHIKAIVTAKEVFLVNSSNPLMVQFVEDLKSRIVGSNGAPQPAMESNGAISETGVALSDGHQGSTHHNFSKPETLAPKLLPFEFRVLEACLESACRCLESETETLEEEAYPALDALTSKISTLNLDRVRQIKSRLVAISGRVQKVRDELEHLLDDDNDMAEMYLTEKLRTCSMDRLSSRKEVQNALDGMNSGGGVGDSENNSEISVALKTISTEELEMLLEAYFAQLEGILRKLSHMNEYVGDTEDYINIMLDDKQNQMLQMSVILNTANMILNAGIVVVGLFGMNIHISLFEAQPIKFWEATSGTIGGCVALYLIAVGWGRKRFLLT